MYICKMYVQYIQKKYNQVANKIQFKCTFVNKIQANYGMRKIPIGIPYGASR